MKNKIYTVSAKYEFEMIGTSKEDVKGMLDVLMDTLVECHSNVHTGNDAYFPEYFTGKYPRRISCIIKRSKKC